MHRIVRGLSRNSERIEFLTIVIPYPQTRNDRPFFYFFGVTSPDSVWVPRLQWAGIPVGLYWNVSFVSARSAASLCLR